jgi:hypothetical protein
VGRESQRRKKKIAIARTKREYAEKIRTRYYLTIVKRECRCRTPAGRAGRGSATPRNALRSGAPKRAEARADLRRLQLGALPRARAVRLQLFRRPLASAGEAVPRASGQRQFVDDTLELVLHQIEIERPLLHALERSLNKITNNVLVHAEAPDGRLAEVAVFYEQRRI